MKRLMLSTVLLTLCAFFINTVDSYSAARFRMPRQGYAKQAGGNARQKTKVEYDRGSQHYTKNVNPGQTHWIPRDAKNVRVNGLQVGSGSRSTTSPKGATLFND